MIPIERLDDLNHAAPNDAGAGLAVQLATALRSRLSRLVWPLLVGIAAAAVCAPFLHAVFWLGDEGVVLLGAARLLQGKRLYADFFEILPPGSFVVTAAWFWAAGISLLSARVLALLSIAGIACFTYLACFQACRRPVHSALAVFAWLVMTQGFWTEISHHWFTTLASMIAAWAALANLEQPKRGLWKPLIAGLAGGSAAMMVPTRGALAVLAGLASLARRGSRRQILAFIIATSAVPLALLAYLAVQHAVKDAFDDVIVFAATRYAFIQGVPYGYFANAQNFPLAFLFPVLALLVIVCWWHDGRALLGDARFRACLAFGLAGFAGVFPRPDIDHIAFAAPLALPLLANCVVWLGEGPWRKFRSMAAVFGLAICAVPAFSFAVVSQEALHAPTVMTARGKVAFLSAAAGAERLAAQLAAGPLDEAYFLYPFMPVMSFLTAREQVSQYDLFTPGYTTPNQYREACEAVMRRATWVVIDRNWTDPAFLNWIFPRMRDLQTEESVRFEQTLERSFAPVSRLGQFDVRRRTPAADEAACRFK